MSAERPFRIDVRLVVGLLVIGLGVVLLLDNLRLIYAEDVLRFFWPAVFLTGGAIKLVGRGGALHRFLGLALILVGLWLLLEELGYLPTDLDVDDVWPLILVGVGLALVVAALRGGASAGRWEEADPTVSAFALMAGNELTNTSREFRGGTLAAVMGGCDLDLRGAQLAAEGAVIDVFTMWGGIGIYVPEGWSVTSKVLPVMGAYEDTTRPVGADAGKSLTVRGFVIMGGIEVGHGSEAKKRA